MKGPGHIAKGEEMLKMSRERQQDKDCLMGVTGDDWNGGKQDENIWRINNIWNPHHNKPIIDICNNSYLLIANNTKHFTFLGLSYSPFLFWKVKYQVTSTKLMPIQVSLSMWATNLKICRHLPADALRDIILTSKVNLWVRGFCVRKCFFCVTSVWMWVCIQRPSHKGPFN